VSGHSARSKPGEPPGWLAIIGSGAQARYVIEIARMDGWDTQLERFR
jgi:ornithine cyclodeaminase/alanine dehydrogenase-like protein (mu-crystallin family)